MADYLFTLGRQPEISTAEIKAVFAPRQIKFIKKIDNNLIEIESSSLDAPALINKLGGTIKISESTALQENMRQTILNHLLSVQPQGKIAFSLNAPDGKKMALQIKRELKNRGRAARYVEIKNTASILHNQLVKKQSDLTVIKNRLFVTRAIQPIEQFSQMDFDRPGSDSRSGMLPPKLAKIMINLTQIDNQAVLLDPFCGSGTILIAAALMDFTNLTGSDISKKAIKDTQANMKWISKNKKLNYRLFVSDAGRLNDIIAKDRIDAIVSEPYMGEPLYGNEKKSYLISQANKLGDLYINAFQSFHQILKPNGVIVFIIPSFKWKPEWIEINCLETIKKIGFKIEPLSDETPYLRYFREGQNLARQIWKFKKIYPVK